ncbi:hypothetical protein [Candidatus Hydrogenosomobacter endosymbioticus]|uniref:hypothetical protein n=1 Tax=Candidatus Hydrogenosomobacter endosymbioticus TaxID=2558174 RepID=UPI001F2D8CF2|nr:hypothetical protein [Candidatus Hydrogenosomobacter endosymbioticus]
MKMLVLDNRRCKFLSVVCCFVSFSSLIGSSFSPIISMPLIVGAFSLPIALAMTDRLLYDKKKIYIFCSIIVAVFCVISYRILNTQVLTYIHNGKFNVQTNYCNSKYLKYIKIDSNFSRSIDSVIAALQKEHFDYSRDKIFVYPLITGLLAASGATAFGTAHNPPQDNNVWFRGYDKLNSAFLKIEKPINVRHVYLLTTEISELENPQLLEFKTLSLMLEPKENSKKIDLGKIALYNDNTLGEKRTLYLVGPYVFREKH